MDAGVQTTEPEKVSVHPWRALRPGHSAHHYTGTTWLFSVTVRLNGKYKFLANTFRFFFCTPLIWSQSLFTVQMTTMSERADMDNMSTGYPGISAAKSAPSFSRPVSGLLEAQQLCGSDQGAGPTANTQHALPFQDTGQLECLQVSSIFPPYVILKSVYLYFSQKYNLLILILITLISYVIACKPSAHYMIVATNFPVVD